MIEINTDELRRYALVAGAVGVIALIIYVFVKSRQNNTAVATSATAGGSSPSVEYIPTSGPTYNTISYGSEYDPNQPPMPPPDHNPRPVPPPVHSPPGPWQGGPPVQGPPPGPRPVPPPVHSPPGPTPPPQKGPPGPWQGGPPVQGPPWYARYLTTNPNSQVSGANEPSWYKVGPNQTLASLAHYFGVGSWTALAYNPHNSSLLHTAYLSQGQAAIPEGQYVWITRSTITTNGPTGAPSYTTG
jgi:hypothetical protein